MTSAVLRRLVEDHAAGRGVGTGVPHQHLTREDASPGDVDLRYRPMLCFVVGGAKTTTAGPVTTRVRSGEMFLSRFDLPVVAAYEPSYRSVTMDIDEALLAGVLAEAPPSRPERNGAPGAIMSAEMNDGIVAAVTRWVALVAEPDLVTALAPRLEGEILLRVLQTPLGAGLRRAVAAGPMASMRDLTRLLSDGGDELFTVAELASRAGMSPATLFRHFRAATGMSPGQFQKVTRLQRARRLLAGGSHTASAAAAAVGHVGVSQFIRDYREHYGTRDGLLREVLREARRRQVEVFTELLSLRSDESYLTTLARAWSTMTGPHGRPYLRLFGRLHDTVGEPLWPGFRRAATTDWLAPLEEGMRSLGHPGLATLVLAVIRGLLKDLDATGDDERCHRAFDDFLARI